MHRNEIVVSAEDFDTSKLVFIPRSGGRNPYSITYDDKELILKGSSDIQLVERRLTQNCISRGEKYFTYHQTDESLLEALNAIASKVSLFYGKGYINPVKEGIFKAESTIIKCADNFTYPPLWRVKSCLQIGKKFHIKYVNVHEKFLSRTLPLHVAPEVKDEQLCVICLENEKRYAVIPCGHLCLCVCCADLIRGSGQCPICMTKVDDIYKIYQ